MNTVQDKEDASGQSRSTVGLGAGGSGCPCLYVTPCSPNCTCAKPFMSGGCSRCARWGSPEQQRKMAESLAAKIDAPNVKARGRPTDELSTEK